MGISIALFGGPVIKDDERGPIQLPTRKSEALLTYLVEAAGHPVSREHLGDLLWPHSGQDQARASLRQETSVLRKALGPEHNACLVTHGDRIAFDCADARVDLWRFRAVDVTQSDAVELTAALRLYKAPFLDAFRVRSQPFSDWLWTIRQGLEATALTFGTTALKQLDIHRNPDQAAETAQALCRIDPTFELAHRTLIELYLSRGEIDLAKRQLRECTEALRSQLDAPPSDETLALAERIARGADRPVSAGHFAQQRREVTVLAVQSDIQSADPEDFATSIASLSDLAGGIVSAKGGTLFLAHNDRLLFLFGYPTAHDRQVDIAADAALDILDARERGASRGFSCRIGLSRGVALVSDNRPGGGLALSGAVVRDAEALCLAAPKGAALIDDAVRSALSPAIQTTPTGVVPGAAQLTPHGLRSPSNISDQFPRRHHPMVGRDAPLQRAVVLLDNARIGKGAAAAILGAPGEGKTRLVQEIIEGAEDRGFDIQLFQGRPGDTKSTFAPVLDHLLRVGVFADSTETDRRAALESWLIGIDAALAPATDYFLSLTGGPATGETVAVSKAAKECALSYFSACVRNVIPTRPLLLIFEDAHWFDPTTCEAITRVTEDLARVPVLALMVARQGEQPRFMDHPLIQDIRLQALDPVSAEALLRGLLKEARASDALIANVLRRTEGNPLAIEQFAQAIDASAAGLSELGLEDLEGTRSEAASEELIAPPDRLLPLLLARIDDVPGAMQVLQCASVLGRRFALVHLRGLLGGLKVRQPLFDTLEAADIIFASRQGADAAYIFKHALIGEAIYSTIPKRDRRALHRRAAEVLGRDDGRPMQADIARHYRAAEDYEQAAAAFEASGNAAVQLAAHEEAISEFSAALSMLAHAPFSEVRARGELSLNRKIAAQYIALRGIPTNEAKPYYARVQQLSQDLGDAEEAVNAIWGLWSIDLMVAELDPCLSLASDLKARLDDKSTVEARLVTDYMLGVTHAYRGTLHEAAAYLRAVSERHTPALSQQLKLRFGMEIGVTSDSFLGWVLALLGDIDGADAASARALQRAQEDNSGLSVVFAHLFSATKCLFADQFEQAEFHAKTARRGAEAMQFGQWVNQADMQLARLADLRGEPGAVEALQAAIENYVKRGMMLAHPYTQVWIAEAYIRRGEPAQAIAILDDLETFTQRTKERYFDARAEKARRWAEEQLSQPTQLASGP